MVDENKYNSKWMGLNKKKKLAWKRKGKGD